MSGSVLFRPMTDRAESLKAFEAFKAALTVGARPFKDQPIGWRGGSTNVEAYWREGTGLWSVFLSQPPSGKHGFSRFWNCFGVGEPKHTAMLRITVEINPPHEGEERRTAGVFLSGQDGELYVGHSGKVGGGRPGMVW